MKATKIVRLEAEGFKRLRAVAIEPDGAVVVVSGRNAQGKSSVLDAIWAALGGKRAFPRKPVREGADEATIRLELEDLIIERRIKPDGQTSLVVSSREGARFPSPQAMLDKLVGSLSFDPLAFARMEPKRQRELLRELVGLDTSTIDAERARLFDERTAVNREVKRLEGEISGVPAHPDAPAAEVSVAELAEDLRNAEQYQRAIDRAKVDVERCSGELQRALDTRADLRAQITKLEQQIAELRERLYRGEVDVIPSREKALDDARARVDELTREAPDREAIAARLTDAESINAKVRANARRAELQAKHKAVRAQADKLSKAIAKCDADKAALVAGVAYPLPGLSVDEQGVLLNGLPLEQASSAEQLRVSVAIGLALNPQLRVLLVRDGSLLDDDSLRLLHQLAEEADAQVWLEAVGAREMGVVIEDGAVMGAVSEAAQ